MLLPLPLDNGYIKAAARAAFREALNAAEKDEKAAGDDYAAAEKRLAEASSLVSAYRVLLEGIEAEQAGVSDAPTSDKEEEEDHSKYGSHPVVIKKRRLGGIDTATWEQLEKAGSPRTSDELVALVASIYPEAISPKSVKNALGEFVRDGRVIKQYSKESQAFCYAMPEWIEDKLNEDALPEHTEQPNKTQRDLEFSA